MNSKKIFLYFIYSTIIAGAYFGSSLIVKPIILPPSFAAPIWPAAGFGVAVLIFCIQESLNDWLQALIMKK